jgi:hypothetical protein
LKVRLDQILLRNGSVSEEQIRKALMRQKSRGGKLGTHLLYYRYVTEDDLVKALAEQIHLNGVRLSDFAIPDDVLRRIPAEIAENFVAIPFRHDFERGELHVAVADPSVPNAANEIRRASGVPRIVLYVAPEAVIRNLVAFHYRGTGTGPAIDQVIDLPDLFDEGGGATEPEASPDAEPARGAASERVLMFTRQLILKSALPPLFEREGFALTVATSTAEIAEALSAGRCSRLLVSDDARSEFERFAAGPGSALPLPEVSWFRAVGAALADNPVPYDRMAASLLSSAREIANLRTAGLPASPPYALIANESGEMARQLGLGRLATDGLRIAAHLLGPDDAGGLPGGLDASADIARRLEFAWDIPAAILSLKSASPATDQDYGARDGVREPSVPAGILALAWHRHHALRAVRGKAGTDLDTLKTLLRRQAGRLAPSAVVEAYIRMIEQSDLPVGIDKDLVIVGAADTFPPSLATELRFHGFRIVHASGFPEARQVYDRRRPAAIVIQVDESPAAADAFCRQIRESLGDSATALFAVTRKSDPSFLLNLMESWFSDVLPLPMNGQVVIARITRVLSTAERDSGGSAGQGFSATFRDLAFTDLVQTLGTGMKSVRMHIEHGDGTRADIYFRKGRIVHASCGELSGVDVIYRVICMQEDGSFRVEPADDFPNDNVMLPTDYILLEGSRLLDEKRPDR